MQTFWIKFSDGSEGSCQGDGAYDARRIAEKITGKTVEGPKYEGGPNVQSLPYPASPVIWQFDHPVHGKTPSFCYCPKECKGHTSCRQRRSCTE